MAGQKSRRLVVLHEVVYGLTSYTILYHLSVTISNRQLPLLIIIVGVALRLASKLVFRNCLYTIHDCKQDKLLPLPLINYLLVLFGDGALSHKLDAVQFKPAYILELFVQVIGKLSLIYSLVF